MKGDAAVVKWAILGCGGIANDFLQSLEVVPGAEAVACASKSMDRARALADKFSIPHAFASYEEMLTQVDIDAVYIATTHNFHHENALLCLEHGKHLLIEKPVTLDAEQLEDILNLANEKKLFVMEAMWTRFLPGIEKLKREIAGGAIGEVVMVNAQFGFRGEVDYEHRLYNKSLGGGSLLDLGIYPIAFSNMIFEQVPVHMNSSAMMAETGVDALSTYHLKYANGATSLLSSSIITNLGATAKIYGTLGSIEVHGFFHLRDFKVIPNEGEAYVVEADYEATGKQFEIMEVMNCLAAGQLESQAHPHAAMRWMMQTMDGFRKDWGMEYS